MIDEHYGGDVDQRLGLHWIGNTAAPGSSFVADGHCLFLKEAAHSWAMPLLAVPHWDVRPVAPEEACRAIFDKAVAAAVVDCRFGWCYGGSDYWQLEVLRDDDAHPRAWLSPYKAVFLVGVVQPDQFRQSKDPLGAVVFYRAGLPVGIIMPLRPPLEIGERFAWPAPPASPEGTT